MHTILSVAAVVATLCGVGQAFAAEPAPIQLVLKDHRFTPAEIHLPAGQAAVLEVTNADPTPDEFEMRQLAIEKVIPGGATAHVRLHPLGAGSYKFVGEFNEATAQGVIIVEAPK